MKNKKDPKLIVLQFNESINSQDIEGLSELMATDYTFIDSSDEVHTDKERNVKGWGEFFKQFPDYINHFSTVASKGNTVLVTGHSTCSDDRLDGPAIWTAKVENDLVAEWRVYLDTPENRKELGLPIRK
jgi:ketosteroid isomerase-like protein